LREGMRNTTDLFVVYFDIVDECEIRGKPHDPDCAVRCLPAGHVVRETTMVVDEVGRYDKNLKRPFVNRLAELVSWSQE